MLELLLVLTIVGILLLLALPRWSSTVADQQVERVATRVEQAIRFARATALNHHQRVVLCGSRDQRHCDGQWSDGWLLLAVNKKPLRHYADLASAVKIDWRSSFGRNGELVFSAQGYSEQQGRFCIWQAGAKSGVALVVARSGRVRREVCDLSG